MEEERIKRSASLEATMLLVVIILVSAFSIRIVKASTTIYIRADGSIDPSTSPIHRDGNVYTLTGDIRSDADGIVIEAR